MHGNSGLLHFGQMIFSISSSPTFLAFQYGDMGVYLSITTLVIVSLGGIKSESEYIVVVLFSSLLICGLVLWFWWKSRMVKEYMEQLRQREQRELEAIIS